MGLWQGFKSVFVGEDEIEDEVYSSYVPKPAQTESAPPPPAAPSAAEQERAVRDDTASARRNQASSVSARRQQTSYQSAARSDRSDRSYGRNDTYGRQGRNTERESDVRMATTEQSSFDLVLARPNNFKEVEKIGTDINTGRTVILNLELVKSEDATRILDFIWGVAFANDCEIKMMAAKTYAIIPRSVNFSGVDLVSELENNGYSF
ncbi:MAG: cell division protein SepF [Ruminococcus sp.]|nr:cell division protein SepF [Ruminococcus sp.]